MLYYYYYLYNVMSVHGAVQRTQREQVSAPKSSQTDIPQRKTTGGGSGEMVQRGNLQSMVL